MKEALDLIQAGGTLAFALLALGALLTGRVQPKHVVDSLWEQVQYERQQKERAFKKAEDAQASHDRMAAALENQNRIAEDRVTRARVTRKS